MLVHALITFNRSATELVKNYPDLVGMTDKASKKIEAIKAKFNLPVSETLLYGKLHLFSFVTG